MLNVSESSLKTNLNTLQRFFFFFNLETKYMKQLTQLLQHTSDGLRFTRRLDNYAHTSVIQVNTYVLVYEHIALSEIQLSRIYRVIYELLTRVIDSLINLSDDGFVCCDS